MKRSALLSLVAVFVLPLVAAKVVLELGWFHGASTNKGELLSPPLALPGNAADGKWRIAYLLPQQCGQRCRQALFTLRQGYLALGREQDRVESWLLLSDRSDRQILDGSIPAELRLKPLSEQQHWPEILSRSGTLFLVDPGGYLVLAYQLTGDSQQDLLIGKDLLSDLRRLLKLS